MTQYTEYETSSGQTYIIRIDNEGVQSSIPNDPANSDYQRYLRWLEDPTATDQPIGGNK